MAPVIHCVRHAQGFHNLGPEFYSIRDPRLTPFGEEQCGVLRDTSFPDQSKISLITASPLRRTLHTAILTFSPALTSSDKSLPPILALPDTQETGNERCNTGSDPPVLRGILAENNWPVDMSLVTDDWVVKTPGTRYTGHSDAVAARARDARILLREKARELVQSGDVDAHVVLVSHGGYLHFFTDDWEDSWHRHGTGWSNCETRSYVFEHDLNADVDAEARLTETMESRQKRGKTHPMYPRECQPELFNLAMEHWESQGLERLDRL